MRSVRSNLIVRRVGSFVLPEAIRDDLIHVTRGLSRESGGEVLHFDRPSRVVPAGTTLFLEKNLRVMLGSRAL